MWRRVSVRLRALPLDLRRRPGGAAEVMGSRALASSPSPFQKTGPLFSSDSGSVPLKKRVEDVMPIATGLEREELEAELKGGKRFDMDAPIGPFGTKSLLGLETFAMLNTILMVEGLVAAAAAAAVVELNRKHLLSSTRTVIRE